MSRDMVNLSAQVLRVPDSLLSSPPGCVRRDRDQAKVLGCLMQQPQALLVMVFHQVWQRMRAGKPRLGSQHPRGCRTVACGGAGWSDGGALPPSSAGAQGHGGTDRVGARRLVQRQGLCWALSMTHHGPISMVTSSSSISKLKSKLKPKQPLPARSAHTSAMAAPIPGLRCLAAMLAPRRSRLHPSEPPVLGRPYPPVCSRG